MTTTRKPFLYCLIISLFFTKFALAEPKRAKFEPDNGSVLVFIGQDNVAVGGTKKWHNGYVDNIGIPAGVTHYVYFAEGIKNNFGFDLDKGTVDGLNRETTWGAGPMCMECYLQSEKLKNTVIHLSISMEFGSEDKIASGEFDHLIVELAEFLERYQDVPFFIRIGYEFDGAWNDYDAPNFKLSWRRIVDALNEKKLNNFATVFASSSPYLKMNKWLEYWPGDEYVDWIGYSYWANSIAPQVSLELARKKNKPIFIAETTPRGFWLNKTKNSLIWSDWFQILFDHIEANSDVIKAVSYINTDWDAQPMWDGWGDSRIETNPELKERWLEKMAEKQYIHHTKGTYDLIGFTPKK